MKRPDYTELLMYCVEHKDFLTTRVWVLKDLSEYLKEKTGLRVEYGALKMIRKKLGIEIKSAPRAAGNVKASELEAKLHAAIHEMHRILHEEVGVDYERLANLRELLKDDCTVVSETETIHVNGEVPIDGTLTDRAIAIMRERGNLTQAQMVEALGCNISSATLSHARQRLGVGRYADKGGDK